MIAHYIDRLRAGHDLEAADIKLCLAYIFNPYVDDEKTAAFLDALNQKPESSQEIYGFVNRLLAHSVPFETEVRAIDLCGTGGSLIDRFNVSTAASFIVSAGGVPVAKHGNRGSRIPNGSFDLLEQIGVPIELDVHRSIASLETYNLCFLFAKKYHPIVGQVSAARKRVGRRTIFNLTGPLSNPAPLSAQIVGTIDQTLAGKMMAALKMLGRKRALVVTGEPGIDEISISGDTLVQELRDGEITTYIFNPENIGLKTIDYAHIPCGDVSTNAKLLHALIYGEEKGPLLQLVALNAGAAFYLVGQTSSIRDGYELSIELIRSGAVSKHYESYLKFVTSPL